MPRIKEINSSLDNINAPLNTNGTMAANNHNNSNGGSYNTSYSNNIDNEGAMEKLLPVTVVNYKSDESSPLKHSPTATSAASAASSINTSSPEHKLAQLSSRTSMSIKEEENEEDVVELRNPCTATASTAHSPTTPNQQQAQQDDDDNSQLLLLKRPSVDNDIGGGGSNTNNSHASLTPKSSLTLPPHSHNDDALSASGSEGATSNCGSTGGSGAGAVAVAAGVIENTIGNCDSTQSMQAATATIANAITTATTAPTVTNTTTTTTTTTTNSGSNLLVSDIPEAKSRRKLSVQGKWK